MDRESGRDHQATMNRHGLRKARYVETLNNQGTGENARGVLQIEYTSWPDYKDFLAEQQESK